MSKSERLYKIQKMLANGAVVTTQRFMDELEISRATFKRDIEYLRDRLGAPILWDPHAGEAGGYRLDARPGEEHKYQMPGLWLDEAEISGLLTVIDVLSRLEPTSVVGKQIKPIRARLEKMLEMSDFTAREIQARIRLIPVGSRKLQGTKFQVVAHALLARKRLFIRYFGRGDGQVSEREVSPARLVYYRDNWYLDAYCHLRNDVRSFSVDAIEALRETELKARDIEAQMLTDRLDSGYGIFAGLQLKKARLKFSPFRARWVMNEVWHPDQHGELLDDGSYLLEVPYLDDRELLHDILRQGQDVEILAPDDLRQKVAAELRAMLGKVA